MNPEQPSFKPVDETELELKTSAERLTGSPEQPTGSGKELAVDSVFADKYKITARLGAGGMSVVYKATDLVLNRTVAIKILSHQRFADDQSLLRFQQEARAAGALSHPGIVGVHEFARSDDGQTYLVMDYVDGKSLADLIAEKGHLSIEQSTDIISQTAEALGYAHQKGIVHRDLKPSNIMLVADESGKLAVKIVDFGIAKITTLEEGLALTKTGEIFGSPLYMSPEQCSGARVDARSDIYSLGCVMYETLVGRPPHSGDTALATAVKHLHDEPESLSDAYGEPFPEAVEAIVSKALEKDVDDRYQSMADFRSDLKLLVSTPDTQTTRSAPARATKKRINYLLYVPSILLMASSGFAIVLFSSGVSIGNFKLQFLLQYGPLLVGFNMFLLSFVLCSDVLVKRSSKRKTWQQRIEFEFQALQPAAAQVSVTVWQRLALLFIIQMIIFGLGAVWSQHPERSLFDSQPVDRN